MEIITRNEDGSLEVPVPPDRHALVAADEPASPPEVMTLHPGAGGFDAALAEWDLQQHDGQAAVSTASGREEAMSVVHQLGDDPSADLTEAVAELNDADASADALRHVLVGGVHAVEDFATEVADHEGGDPLPSHQVTKIIGDVLAEVDSESEG